VLIIRGQSKHLTKDLHLTIYAGVGTTLTLSLGDVTRYRAAQGDIKCAHSGKKTI
jgi:hypothetical protein